MCSFKIQSNINLSYNVQTYQLTCFTGDKQITFCTHFQSPLSTVNPLRPPTYIPPVFRVTTVFAVTCSVRNVLNYCYIYVSSETIRNWKKLIFFRIMTPCNLQEIYRRFTVGGEEIFIFSTPKLRAEIFS